MNSRLFLCEHRTKWPLVLPLLLFLVLSILIGTGVVHAIGQPQTASAQATDDGAGQNPEVETAETESGIAAAVWQTTDWHRFDDAPYLPGELLVGFDADAVVAAALLSDVNATILETLDLAGLDGADGDAGIVGYRLQVPVGQEWQIATRLEAEPSVAFAEPNWLAQLADDVEMLSTEDSGEKRTIQPADEHPFQVSDKLYEQEQWYLQRMNASRAWSLALAQPLRRVRVAVIDTGVDTEHPDLEEHLAPGFNLSEPGSPPDDDNGHGTHMAGLIGAVLNNGEGIAGTAVQVQIVPYKVFRWIGSSYQAPSVDISSGVRAAADAGIEIINLSLELGAPSAVVEAALNYADARGVLVIGAAGNCRGGEQQCPPPISYPAKYDVVMAIGATGYDDIPTYYSAIGDELEVVAPGGDGVRDIMSTWPNQVAQNCDPSTFVGGDEGSYCGAVGTSMAAAQVSGVAALVWSVNPDMDADEVRSILRETAVELNYDDDEAGSGRVDAYAAVRRGLRSTIEIAQRNLVYTAPLSGTQFVEPVTIENPSLDPITWGVKPIGSTRWLTFTGAYSGSARYGRSAQVSLLISPTHLVTGTYHASFWIEGSRSDGSRVIQPVNVQLQVAQVVLPPAIYLPTITRLGDGELPEIPYDWEITSAAHKRYYGMTDQSSIGITLPFTITLHGRSFVDARIYSDGFVVFPAGNISAGGTNQCLDNVVWPQQAIYAWWADLNPGAGGGSVSTFLQDDHFVIEFLSVPSASGYVVSFQIVLYKDGAVGLNYRNVTGVDVNMTRATVGLMTQDGRFYYQVACHVNGFAVGELPHSKQSLLFRSEELF